MKQVARFYHTSASGLVEGKCEHEQAYADLEGTQYLDGEDACFVVGFLAQQVAKNTESLS